jgi:hypothetical protein
MIMLIIYSVQAVTLIDVLELLNEFKLRGVHSQVSVDFVDTHIKNVRTLNQI